MEVKPGYTPPLKAMQVQPPVYAQPMMPPAMPPAMAPTMQKPVHHDIHLEASYQQTAIVFPSPKPVHTAAYAAKPCYPRDSAGSILVLFILLVIISRGFHKC